MKRLFQLTGAIFAALVLGSSVQAADGQAAGGGLTIVRFVTDWKAQAEHGGFYQAIATGLYAQRGLQVEIMQGGSGVNVPQLMAGGAADFGMGSNSFIPLNLVDAGAPVVAVAAIFQKDPQVLLTHPRDDIRSIADMKGKPIMISDASIGAFWIWLRAKFGFEDAQIRKYTFNVAPFLVDTNAIQQGYLSSEPYLIEKEGGFRPQVFLLADYGYPGYANMILAPQSWVEQKPEIVRAFVEASIEGWRSYLYGDPAPGNALIMGDNPEMTQDVLDQAVDKLRSFGIVGADQAKIGAMTEARWQEFFEVMSANGVFRTDLDWRKAYTTQFLPQ